MTGTHVAGGLVTTAAVGLVRLPCDRWLANHPTEHSSSRTHPVPEPVLERFLGLAQEPDGGADAVLAAVLAVLLHHYAGQQDVELTLDGPGPVRISVEEDADLRGIRQQVERQLAEAKPTVEPAVERRADGAEAPLTVRLRLAGAGALLEAGYDPALLDGATADRVLEHTARLLAALVADPGGPVRRARFGSARERERILADWNGTRTPYPDSTVVAAFEEQARATPAAPAVEFEGAVLSYAELDRRAALVSRRLNAGATAGFVGIHLERSVELVVAILGVLRAGLAYVPLDPELPADRVRYMVEDSGAATVLCRPEDVEALARPGVTALTVHQAEREGAQAPETGRPEITGDTPIYLIYTSGSTGRPKGVLNRHAGVFNTVHWRRRRFPLGPADRVLQKTPFGFDVSAWEFLWPLVSGACLVVARPGGHRDTRYLKRTVRDRGVTVIHFVPSMLDAFLEEDDLAGHCADLRLVFASGEALAPTTVRAFFRQLDCELHNLYGPTEASIEVSHWQAAPDFAGRDVPIGRPIANTGLYVVDERLEPVPVGVAGELCIGGVQVALGYHRQPELTRERFVADPFTPGGRLYRTGDLARFRTDGQIEYLGRLDDQVKISGFRIELGEIETVLRGLPGVGQAAVLPVGEDGARRLAAFVVPAGPGAFDPEKYRSALSELLPGYMVPKQFTELAALPTSTNGKLDRRALAGCAQAAAAPALAPAPTPADAAGDAAGTEYTEDTGSDLETTLRALFAQSLGVAEVGLHEDYFELGGHSLAAVKLATRIRAALGVDLDVWTLFDFPTVAELARELARPL
ncbi:amino acid adenylation domain-containing protein [Kitasatospora sp. NPDC098652]|uniref:non-ribosomal peptide synthetase n=1 Tax=Kitasatospora sp. NPDC098652 TaxID=3364095 RepID=UPI003811202C